MAPGASWLRFCGIVVPVPALQVDHRIPDQGGLAQPVAHGLGRQAHHRADVGCVGLQILYVFQAQLPLYPVGGSVGQAVLGVVGRVKVGTGRPGLLGAGLLAGDKPVNVVQRQAGVGNRFQARLLGQPAATPVHGHAVPAPVHVGLAPTDNGNLAPVLPDSHTFPVSHPACVANHLSYLIPFALLTVPVGTPLG